MTRVAKSVQTPFGRVASGWQISDGFVTLTIAVPAGAQAIVRVTPAEKTTESVLVHTNSAGKQHR
ncbi:alpha-L-rhamnosidase C-terminal domain-containing protein [Nocardia sp. CA-120079]|uniref:alpha-L-rhamnosidase C-terminal domain-containing protein n=1 Tax=Nocardia sp. CA-120079 TaxID=3239974 RepID=UPI003D991C1A